MEPREWRRESETLALEKSLAYQSSMGGGARRSLSRRASRLALCSESTFTVYAVYGSPTGAQPASPSLSRPVARVAARAIGSFAACLEAVTGALDGLLLRADGDGEVGILGTLRAEDEARGGAGEGEEGVHGLAAAEALRSLLEELLLLPRVAGGGVLAVHVPGAGGGLGVGEVEVDGLVAVLSLGGDRAVE